MGKALSSALLLGGAISLLFSKRGALMDLSKSLLLLKKQDEGIFFFIKLMVVAVGFCYFALCCCHCLFSFLFFVLFCVCARLQLFF